MFVNHYEMLGVAHDADLVQITAAWKRLIKKYHPDLNQNDEDATEQTILVNKAYEILSDSAKRAQYDRQLEEHLSESRSSQAQDQVNHTERASQDRTAAEPSFASKQKPTFQQAGKGKDRATPPVLSMSIIGIVLGVLTAIPIGVFLVWMISGFDPLGIFRTPPDDTLAISPEQQSELNQSGPPEANDRSEKARVSSTGETQSSSKSTAAPKLTEQEFRKNPAGKSSNPGKALPSSGNNAEPGASKKEFPPHSTLNTPEKTDSSKGLTLTPKRPTVRPLLAQPPESEVSAAKEKIREAFEQQYRQANVAKGLQRLEKLRDLSLEISSLATKENDSVASFALYEVSIDMGRLSCFAVETLKIVDEFESRFEVEGLEIRLELFQYWRGQLPKIIPDSTERKKSALRLASTGEPFIARAIAEQKWKTAAEFAKFLRLLFSNAGDERKPFHYTNLEKELAILTAEKTQVDIALKGLEQNPDHAENNFVVGAYYCFQIGDWKTGLPYLVKCNRPDLADCARKDLAELTDDQVVGDKWWQLASVAEWATFRSALIRRACDRYRRAMVGSGGIQREILRKRILEYNKLPLSAKDQTIRCAQLLKRFKSDSVRFLDYKNKTWENDIRSLFSVTNQVDGCGIACDISDGYVHKLLLFPAVDVNRQKLVVAFTVETGDFGVGLRPADLRPRGATVDMKFEKEQKYVVEIWLENKLAKCTVNGLSVDVVQEPWLLGIFSFSFSQNCRVVIHDLRISDRPPG